VPFYYFHLCNGSDVLLDPDGRDLASLGEVEECALSDARAIISHDALDGNIDLGYHIDVQDKGGRTVHTLRFRDAVTIKSD
jgi:hypothetical protein